MSVRGKGGGTDGADVRKKLSSMLQKRAPIVLAIAIYIVFCFFVTGCPIKFMTGIPCPGCGMTRAVTSALHLDLAEAFRYHPLFPLAPFLIIYLIFEDALPRRVSHVLAVFFAVTFISVYIFRLIIVKSPVLAIDIGGCFIVKCIKHIAHFIAGA